MKPFTTPSGALPTALLLLLGAACRDPDAGLRIQLAQAEAKAKLAGAQLQRMTADLTKQAAEEEGGAASAADGIAALRQENEALREKLSRVSSVAPASVFNGEVAQTSLVDGIMERRKEWKQALADFKVLNYETPEVAEAGSG